MDGRTDEDTSSYGGFTGTKYLDGNSRYKGGGDLSDGIMSDVIDSSTYGVHPPSGFSDTRQPSEAECDLHRAGVGGTSEGDCVGGSVCQSSKLHHQISRSSGRKDCVLTPEEGIEH